MRAQHVVPSYCRKLFIWTLDNKTRESLVWSLFMSLKRSTIIGRARSNSEKGGSLICWLA